VWWDLWPLLCYEFTAESVLKEFFKIAQRLAKLWAEKLIASSAVCARAVALSCWKMNLLQIWRITYMAGINCCNSITLRLILVVVKKFSKIWLWHRQSTNFETVNSGYYSPNIRMRFGVKPFLALKYTTARENYRRAVRSIHNAFRHRQHLVTIAWHVKSTSR